MSHMPFAICSPCDFDPASRAPWLAEKVATIPAAGHGCVAERCAGDLVEAAVLQERHVAAIHAPGGASAYWSKHDPK